MKPIKIVIAAAVIMFASNVLSGCNNTGRTNSIGAERILEAQALKKSVTLSLETLEGNEDLTVRVLLRNPGKKPLTSIQTWLAYNPKVLKGISLNVENSPFKLMAPYKNDFDQEAGLVMIGRSNATPVDDAIIEVAELRFERVGKGAVMIEAYDYKQDLDGHTSANMMLDGAPINVLLKPETPLFISSEK